MTGSVASVKGFHGFGVYSASNAALRSFARTWLNELKSRNILLNLLQLMRTGRGTHRQPVSGNFLYYSSKTPIAKGAVRSSRAATSQSPCQLHSTDPVWLDTASSPQSW